MRKFAFSVPVIAFMFTLAYHSLVRTVVFYDFAAAEWDSKMVWVWNAPQYYRPMANIPLEILIMMLAMTAFLLLLASTSKPKPDTCNPTDWKREF